MNRKAALIHSRDALGFTLIELMISIALVLVMMLGVNYVFSSVGQATGLTQAVSRVTRDTQAAQSVMYRDFNTADMTGAPFIVIQSFPTYAFRNREDFLSAANQGRPMDDVDPLAGPLTYTATTVNNRIHRTDLLLFFSRDKFSRQTGGGTFNPASGTPSAQEPFLADMSCQEAMIWYGHLKLPDDNLPGTFLNPGQGQLPINPNNFFASQWILGRAAILLQEPTDPTGKIETRKPERDALGNIVPNSYDTTWHWSIKEDDATSLDPLRWNSLSNSPVRAYRLEESRFDLAGTTMARMSSQAKAAAYTTGWWNSLMSGRRFQARPFLMGGPGSRLTPEAVALQSPIFVNNCSQFIVEFAGDFMKQQANGNLDPTPGTDGIDFNYDSVTQTRSVRWYGFPRDTNGNGTISAADGDTLPVRDYIGTRQLFEQLPFPAAAASQYGALPAVPPPVAPPRYTCAWSPNDMNRPKMFRITMAIDDPNGRFSDPLTFEYVFKVP